MASNSTPPLSAFAFLQQHRELPVLKRSSKSTAGAAWGNGSRQWSRAVPSKSPMLDAVRGDVMPRELRTLVGASYDVFMRFGRLASECERTQRELPPLEIVKASRQYREALKTCIFTIEDRVEQQTRSRQDSTSSAGTASPSNRDKDTNKDNDESFVELLKVSLAIWHLCELLILQRRPRDDKFVAYDLAQWLQEHFVSAQLEILDAASAALQQIATPEDDPAFWPTLHAFAMAGCGERASALLGAHSSVRALAASTASSSSSSSSSSSRTSAATRATFDAVQRLLLSMPHKRSIDNNNNAVDWSAWHDACVYVLTTDSYVKTHAGLATLVRILAADDATLERHATTWYELMLARLVLDAPTRVAHRFEFLMARCFQVYAHDKAATMNNFDCIIVALLELDVASALQNVHALGFSWMAAHLSDLLVKSNAVTFEPTFTTDVTLHELFLVHYASDIGASEGVLALTLGYYERCPRFGLVAARSALLREPVETDAKTHALLALCHGKRALSDVERLTTRRRAQRCEQQRLIGAALVWLLRGGYHDDVDAVCMTVVDTCAANAESATSLSPSALATLHDATEFLEANVALAQTPLLAWLVRFRDLRLVLDDCTTLCDRLRSSESSNSAATTAATAAQLRFVQHEAATRLDALVRTPAAPCALRAVLLADAAMLLAVEPTVFATAHIYALLAYVQQLERAFDRAAFVATHANAQLVARVERFLARNLAEAIVTEARAAQTLAVVAGDASSSSAGSRDAPRLAGSAPMTMVVDGE